MIFRKIFKKSGENPPGEPENEEEKDSPEDEAPPPEPVDEETDPDLEPGAADESAEAGPPVEEETKGLFGRFRERLSRTRARIDAAFSGKKAVTEDLLEELEEALITADFGVAAAMDLVGSLRAQVKKGRIKDPEDLRAALREAIRDAVFLPAPELDFAAQKPLVIMVVGVNGVGKTTTIAKLAHIFKKEGLSAMMVAADTFRAAAVEQLEIWAERAGADLIKQKHGADPAAVAFDGMTAAKSRSTDVVLVDTAGRLHTKVNLMEEVKKVHRVIGKALAGAPHEVWLVLDATTGQNAINQAKMFHEALNLTGLILTKLDGTAKGGVTVAVVREIGVPLRYVGLGEGLEDLRGFDPELFARAIF